MVLLVRKKNLILKERESWYSEEEIEHTKMII